MAAHSLSCSSCHKESESCLVCQNPKQRANLMDFTRGEEASSFEASYWFCHARAFLVNKVVQTRLHTG